MSHVAETRRKKVTTQTLLQMKKKRPENRHADGNDALTAEIMDQSGIHSIW